MTSVQQAVPASFTEVTLQRIQIMQHSLTNLQWRPSWSDLWLPHCMVFKFVCLLGNCGNGINVSMPARSLLLR